MPYTPMKFMEIEQRSFEVFTFKDGSTKKLLHYDIEMQDSKGKVLQIMTGLIRADLDDLMKEIEDVLGIRRY